jgi:hypothetical protein
MENQKSTDRLTGGQGYSMKHSLALVADWIHLNSKNNILEPSRIRINKDPKTLIDQEDGLLSFASMRGIFKRGKSFHRQRQWNFFIILEKIFDKTQHILLLLQGLGSFNLGWLIFKYSSEPLSPFFQSSLSFPLAIFLIGFAAPTFVLIGLFSLQAKVILFVYLLEQIVHAHGVL